MGWKEQFEKANTKMKNSVKNKAADKVNLAKEKFKHSNPYQFAKQKGFKNKAKFVGNKALNKFKSTEFFNKLVKLEKGIAKVISFIASNIVPIGITLAVIVVGSNLAILIVGYTQAIGETPHYYCEINPSPSVKTSKAYKQYCENQVSYLDVSNVNGHYIVQDGAGPCVSCSALNMLIRYYMAHGVNLYNYLWQTNGQYTPLASTMDVAGYPDRYNMRRYITGTTGKNDESLYAAKVKYKYGSINFAKNHGLYNYTMANWGYVHDATVGINGSSISTGALTDNPNWVWDLSIKENNGDGSDWGCVCDGTLTIEGCSATVVRCDTPINNVDELRRLLDEHPAGIVIYRYYNADAGHAILLTGYTRTAENTYTFTAVDPALGIMGGVEHSADSCVGAGDGIIIYNNSILNDPKGTTNGQPNIAWYYYIKEEQ